MASSPRLSALSLCLFLLFVMLLPIAQVTLAGRPLPTATNPSNTAQAAQSNPRPEHKQTEAHPDRKQTETSSTNPNSRSQTKTSAPGKKQTEPSSTNPKSRSQTKPSTDKKQTECFGHEGTVLIPGIGRYMIGTMPSVPTVGGTFLGDSVPAAMNGRYLPGNDDTFVPNPGYEVPNPSYGTSP